MLWSVAHASLQHCVGKTRDASTGWFLGLGLGCSVINFVAFFLVGREEDGFFIIAALLLLVCCCCK
jgi:hypothetical protein